MWMKGRDESDRRGMERSLKGEASEDITLAEHQPDKNEKDDNQSITTRGTFLKGVNL